MKSELAWVVTYAFELALRAQTTLLAVGVLAGWEQQLINTDYRVPTFAWRWPWRATCFRTLFLRSF